MDLINVLTYFVSLHMIPKNEEMRTMELSGQVGFNSLPHQVVRKLVAQGFCFNILCVGVSEHSMSSLPMASVV